jgi:NAD-dependent deacetylase
MDHFNLHPKLVPAFNALLRGAGRIVVFSGAGASAESGIATFRDKPHSLWQRFRPEELASPDGFRRNPAAVWGWYEWRRAQVLQAQPNAGHLAIALWQQQGREIGIITQNVDDLHERAGSTNVVHLHGSIFKARCFDCGEAVASPELAADAHLEPRETEPPRCPHCNGLARPGVVWFGENLPEQAWAAAEDLCRKADLLICLGTSALVHPAAGLPKLAAKQGALIAQVNPQPTDHDELADFILRGTAGEIMPRIVAAAMADT